MKSMINAVTHTETHWDTRACGDKATVGHALSQGEYRILSLGVVGRFPVLAVRWLSRRRPGYPAPVPTGRDVVWGLIRDICNCRGSSVCKTKY